MKLITQDTEIVFSEYTQLSYKDSGLPCVTLFIDNSLQGAIKVWKDSEENGREYVCINNEIVYLDTISKIN